MKRGLLFSIILALLIMPLISALGYYSNPLDYLNNEWVKFGIIFALLFASIYFFLNRRMQNPGVAGIIAGGLSALISIPIMQRGLIDSLFGPNIVDWIIIVSLGIMFIFIFYKFGMRTDDYGRRRFSFWRFIFFLVILTIIIYLIGEYIPNTIMFGPIGDWIDIIKGLGVSTIVIIGVVLIAIWLIKWFWGGHTERRTYSRRYGAQKRILGGGG